MSLLTQNDVGYIDFNSMLSGNPDKPPADPKYCCQSGGDSDDVPCPRPGLGGTVPGWRAGGQLGQGQEWR